MPKCLFTANYTPAGMKGLLKDGGTKRRQDLSASLKELNGRLESLYFSFGEKHVFGIVDIPDNVSGATIVMNICASGAAEVSITQLLSPEEIDEASKIGVRYRPPGE